MTTEIHASNLGKYYDLDRAGKSGLGRLMSRKTKPGLWALRDLNFTITAGESVGLIGLNGAGKSTLFKILSHITKPTQGSIEIHGRTGALIELGAGFHPELSGRENIFLYGSILGMKKTEILRRFDEIVSFSELEPYIDAPVKRYSSGMYLRLGFSVAAHLYPDILLIDEILSVGDLAFQRKCLEWMRGYLTSHRIYLLVSHQLHHIENLCKRVLYLNGGRIVFDGPTDQAISQYLGNLGMQNSPDYGPVPTRPRQGGEFSISSVLLLNSQLQPTDSLLHDTPLTIRIDYSAPVKVKHPKVEIAINCEGRRIGQANTISDAAGPDLLLGRGSIHFQWPRCLLTPGFYTVDVFVSDGQTMADLIEWRHCLGFRILAPSGFRMASGDPGWIKIPGGWSFSESRECA